MVYMFLADGFEEVEALAPLDIMRRAGIAVATVGIGGYEITGAHGIQFIADCNEEQYYLSIEENRKEYGELQMIFLPGGMPGTLNLSASETVAEAIDMAINENAYIAAICAAPSILGEKGLLVGKKAVCYPGFEDKLVGAKIAEENVAVDGKMLTARGMGVAVEMGLKIVELLVSKQKADEIAKAIIAR